MGKFHSAGPHTCNFLCHLILYVFYSIANNFNLDTFCVAWYMLPIGMHWFFLLHIGTYAIFQSSSFFALGWTNYTPCYTDEMKNLLKKLYAYGEDVAHRKFYIAERTRTLEIFGLRYVKCEWNVPRNVKKCLQFAIFQEF